MELVGNVVIQGKPGDLFFISTSGSQESLSIEVDNDGRLKIHGISDGLVAKLSGGNLLNTVQRSGLESDIDAVSMSVDGCSLLEKEGINKVKDLVEHTYDEIRSICGREDADRAKAWLGKFGLSFVEK